MGFKRYAEVLSNPLVRHVLLLGMLIRTPLWGANILLTLHIVDHLEMTYFQAGMIAMVVAAGLAISAPWRGRLLDRNGLRRTLAPSVIIYALVWSIAPFVSYWPLMVLAGFAAIFNAPTFSIVRQVLISHVPDDKRNTVLAVDSIAIELTFMVGPILGVMAGTYLPTPVALLIFQLLVAAGMAVMWFANPPLHSAKSDVTTAPVAMREWFSPLAAITLATAMLCTIVLTADELSAVAALREWDRETSIGWVLALWGLGSLLGGIWYGALKRPAGAPVWAALLAGTTALVALAEGMWLFVPLLILTGVFCAPTITSTVVAISKLVPASSRGEAMGWHGSALTFGSAIGAPIVGLAIDTGGWHAGLLYPGIAGLIIAAVGMYLFARINGQSLPREDTLLSADR